MSEPAAALHRLLGDDLPDDAYAAHARMCALRLNCMPLSRQVFMNLRNAGHAQIVSRTEPDMHIHINLRSGVTTPHRERHPLE